MVIDSGRSVPDGLSPCGSSQQAVSPVPASIPNAEQVFVSLGRYGRAEVKRGVLVKRTPTGQVVADFGEVWSGNGKPRPRRFGKDGFEIGGDYAHLIDEAAYDRLAKQQAGQEASAALIEHLRSWSYRNKAELNALVAKLVELADRVPDDYTTR